MQRAALLWIWFANQVFLSELNVKCVLKYTGVIGGQCTKVHSVTIHLELRGKENQTCISQREPLSSPATDLNRYGLNMPVKT